MNQQRVARIILYSLEKLNMSNLSASSGELLATQPIGIYTGEYMVQKVTRSNLLASENEALLAGPKKPRGWVTFAFNFRDAYGTIAVGEKITKIPVHSLESLFSSDVFASSFEYILRCTEVFYCR